MFCWVAVSGSRVQGDLMVGVGLGEASLVRTDLVETGWVGVSVVGSSLKTFSLMGKSLTQAGLVWCSSIVSMLLLLCCVAVHAGAQV